MIGPERTGGTAERGGGAAHVGMDAEQRELFAVGLRHAVTSAGFTPAGATPPGDHAALDAALAELGWAEALDVAPRAAVGGLAEVHGGHTATSSALHRVVAHALTGSADAPGALLPPLGTWAPPGRIVDGRIQIQGLANAALLSSGHLTVAVADSGPADRSDAADAGEVDRADRPDRADANEARGGDSGRADRSDAPEAGGGNGHRADAVGVTAVDWLTVDVDELDVAPARGLDPAAALIAVTGTAAWPGSATAPGRADAGRSWDAAVRMGRLFVAHELQGASASVLAQAREHALDRIQFGRPIASFQAVRHKLAEVLIATETAEALLDAAWIDGTAVNAAMAKASAGRAARLAAKHGQQVLAGIGFTTEHGLHRWVRRILVLDEVLGSSRTLTKHLGTDLLHTRRLPPLLPL